MKKLLLMLLILLLVSSSSFGATSEDMSVYVRKDVYDANMNAFMIEIRGEFQVVNAKLEALSRRIDDNFAVISKRIDDNYYSLDAKISDLRNGLYLGLVLFGTLIALPFFSKWRDEHQKERERLRQPVLTLEDVKRMIEEAKLAGK